MTLVKLKEINPHLEIMDTDSSGFFQYGRVISYEFTDLLQYISEKTQIPSVGNTYTPSDEAMEGFEIKKLVEKEMYGEMPIQIGYCNGMNSGMDTLEYHKCSEINIAATDLVLFLGKVQDINEGKYDSEKVEAFYLTRGTAVELYATTLHFAPCRVFEEGFKCIVILQKHTNLPLENAKALEGEGKLLFAKNKWLLVHTEKKVMVDRGAHIGINGNIIKIQTL